MDENQPAEQPAASNDAEVAPYGYKKDGTPKAKIGRPRGAKNLKKRGHKKGHGPPPSAMAKVKQFSSTNQPAYSPRARATEYYKWREKNKTLKTRYWTQQKQSALWDEAFWIATNRDHPDQARMVEYCIDQCVGKATSKLEVDDKRDGGLSDEAKLELFKALTGLKKPPAPDVVDGSIVIQSAISAEDSGSDSGDRVGVPGLPAPVDLRPEQDSGVPQAGEVRADLRSFVVVDQAPDVPPTERANDQRDIRLEESEDRSGLHGVSAEVGDGDRGALAGVD